MTPSSTPPSTMAPRQKAIMFIFIVVIIIVIWQVISLFKGGSTAPSNPAANKSMANNMSPQASNMQPPPVAVKPNLPSPALTAREIELMQLQKQTEEKYVAALNQLQMLKIERDIAETNKAIVTAKLDTVTAEKSMVTLLQPSVPAGTYAQGLGGAAAPQQASTQAQTQNVSLQVTSNYLVVSVSLLQGKWSAVLGSQGKLYQVFIGDVLPDDGSVVTSIDKYGVILTHAGEKKKISLVPII